MRVLIHNFTVIKKKLKILVLFLLVRWWQAVKPAVFL